MKSAPHRCWHYLALSTAFLFFLPSIRDGEAQASEAAVGGHYRIENALVAVDYEEKTGVTSFQDLRSGEAWLEMPALAAFQLNGKPSVTADSMTLNLISKASGFSFVARISLNAKSSEISVALNTDNASHNRVMYKDIYYPLPIQTSSADSLVLPMNEGMLFPVDDQTVKTPLLLDFFKGGDLSMPWAGLVRGADGAGLMTIIETPDDARLRVERNSSSPAKSTGLLQMSFGWTPSLQAFRYERKLRYVLFDQGGYVAQAKYFRSYAQQHGLWESLAQKTQKRPALKGLMGAANVWAYVTHPVQVAREMKRMGMDRVLWSNGEQPADIDQINELGFLTSRYDNYQDVFPPGAGAKLGIEDPQQIMWQSTGQPYPGWTIKPEKGPPLTSHMDAPARALRRAQAIIPEYLRTHHYSALFLDTVTAVPWLETYSAPDAAKQQHPLGSRSENKDSRLNLLNYVSEQLKLVTGSEFGVAASVPTLDYLEGMVSISPYLMFSPVADSKSKPVADGDLKPEFLRFNQGYYDGHSYRVPLWELVYHDAVIVFPHWIDYANRFSPAIWRQKDLLYILYGTQPMYLFHDDVWAVQKNSIAASYRNVSGVARRVAGKEMVTHQFLTLDGSVQLTKWAGGEDIVVNFGDVPFYFRNKKIEPKTFLLSGPQ